MKRNLKALAAAKEGAAIVEFALVAPFLILLLVGILQLGIAFLANAGLQHAVEAGARYATIYPRPTDAQIKNLILRSGYGMRSAQIAGPTITRGANSGSAYADISMSYTLRMDFIFFQLEPLQLRHERRAYQL
jgi:Flp pilus assembly protein TadG